MEGESESLVYESPADDSMECDPVVDDALLWQTLLNHPAFLAAKMRHMAGLPLIDLTAPLRVDRARRELLPPMPLFSANVIDPTTTLKPLYIVNMQGLASVYRALFADDQWLHIMQLPISTILEHLLFNERFANLVSGPIQFHYGDFYDFACHYPHFNAIIKDCKYKDSGIMLRLFQKVLIPLIHILHHCLGHPIRDVLVTLMDLFPFLVRKTPNKQPQLVESILNQYKYACENVGSSASLLNLSKEKKQTNLAQFYPTAIAAPSPESQKES